MYTSYSKCNYVKENFLEVYEKKLPHAYYASMHEVEYQIPENAKLPINKVLSQIKQERNEPLSILDLGCSYGVLSALIKFNLLLSTLYRRYRQAKVGEATLDSERKWFATLQKRDDLMFYGIDISVNAIRYSKEVGLIEGGLAANLEVEGCEVPRNSNIPKNIDLIVSTGCIGYITDATFSSIFEYIDRRSKPVIISFVLRMFDYSQIANFLATEGYKTFEIPNKTFIQRRFSNASEKHGVLRLLQQKYGSGGYDRLPETKGYYHALLFVSMHESLDQSFAAKCLGDCYV